MAGVTADVFAQLFGEVECAGKVGAFKQYHELLAAETCQQVTATQALLDALAGMTQAGIGGQVALVVSDLLEVIQIQLDILPGLKAGDSYGAQARH